MCETEETGLKKIAYEAHYSLLEHYSSQILRARISIVTVTLVVVAVVFGITPGGDVPNSNAATAPEQQLGIDNRAPIALIGAVFLAFLFLMEIGYLKRLYQVIAAGRRLESDEVPFSYFKTYDPGASWPVYSAYSLGVVVLVSFSFHLAISEDQPVWNTIGWVFLGALSLAGVMFAFARSRAVAKVLLDHEEG